MTDRVGRGREGMTPRRRGPMQQRGREEDVTSPGALGRAGAAVRVETRTVGPNPVEVEGTNEPPEDPSSDRPVRGRRR